MVRPIENIFFRIQDQLPKMSEVSQKIGHYLIENQSEISSLTVSDLANKIKVSEAGISRFAKQLGFNGFKELRLQLIKTPTDNKELMTEIVPTDTPQQLKDKLLLRINHSLGLTNESLEVEKIDEVIELMAKFDYIQVFGIGASDLVAKDLYQKFNRIGKTIVNPPDVHQVLTYMLARGKNQLLILISDTGLTQEIIKVAKAAAEQEIAIVALTANPDSQVAKIADLSLIINGGQPPLQIRTAATTSLISQLFTVDLLFYRYLQKNFADDAPIISKSHQIIREYFK